MLESYNQDTEKYSTYQAQLRKIKGVFTGQVKDVEIINHRSMTIWTALMFIYMTAETMNVLLILCRGKNDESHERFRQYLLSMRAKTGVFSELHLRVNTSSEIVIRGSST